MKLIKKLLLTAAMALLVVGLASCKKEEAAQGIDDEWIYIGNTATTSGPSSAVGVPFNQAIEGRIAQYNALPAEERYLGGRKIKLITYDDKFSADTGLLLTEKLIYEDKVFALVGHFGTPTVGATIDLMNETGIPMVYAATGINDLYTAEARKGGDGWSIMPVQPIYQTDGRIMAARLLKEKVHGSLTGTGVDTMGAALDSKAKVGVLYTNDDAGKGILDGIKEEFEILKRTESLVEQQIDATSEANLNAAALKMKNEGVEAIIIAANQAPFKAMLSALARNGNTADVFSSYVNADPTAFDTKLTYNFNVYVNAWVDILSEKGQAAAANYVAAVNANPNIDDVTKFALYTNSFGIAGYIAIEVFLAGLAEYDKNYYEEGKDVTWSDFIAAMSANPIDIPMGSTVDFSDGKRWGIANMSLLRYDSTAGAFVLARDFEELVDIEKK
ncbi:MAG TPA: ABC transporter substrate-binding protein [Acholeplasmataceae bacterium]|jgi:ABC-type branched-subunit amino acid transport system substrate-binding protein|nr:ABC transporter substrate-binding protein [Acholeplasmataceae bacterium]